MDLKNALGIPSPDGPTQPTEGMSLQVLQVAVKYLLYERAEETALTAAFNQLLQERHHHFHDKAFEETKWTDCGNDVCKQALSIITTTKAKEINVNPLAAELMQRYKINFMPMPANLRVWLTPVAEVLPATREEERIASRVIIPS